MASYYENDPESYDRAMKQLIDESLAADQHFDYQMRRLELGGYKDAPLFPDLTHENRFKHTPKYNEEGGLRFPEEVHIPVPPIESE